MTILHSATTSNLGWHSFGAEIVFSMYVFSMRKTIIFSMLPVQQQFCCWNITGMHTSVCNGTQKRRRKLRTFSVAERYFGV